MFIVNIFNSTNEDSSWFTYIKFRTWECWEFERNFKLGSCKMYVYFNQNLKKLSKLKCWQSHTYLFHDIHNNNFPGMIQTQHFLIQGHSSHTWLMWSVILDLDIFKTRYQCEWYCIFIKKRWTIFNHTMLSSSTSSSSSSFINIMHCNYYHYKGILFFLTKLIVYVTPYTMPNPKSWWRKNGFRGLWIYIYILNFV